MDQTGYVDLQVNGYAGVDFNQGGLSSQQLHQACAQLDAHGVSSILAAIITAPLDVMCDRLATLAKLRAQDKLVEKVIAGFHIEGPFLNETPGYCGAHPSDAMMPASPELMDRLLEASDGLCRLVTLAPERDPSMVHHLPRRLRRSRHLPVFRRFGCR